MQIINFEAFVKDIEYRNEHNKCPKEYAEGARDTLEVAKLFIFERPTGKWIEETDEHLKGMYRCSVCGRRVDGSVLDDLLMIDEDYTISDNYPFCHCGADMRGGERRCG